MRGWFVLLLALIHGCAATEQERQFLIQGIGGDIIIRDIGSDNSFTTQAEPSIQLNTAFPVQSLPVNTVLDIYKSGVFSGYNVNIKDVSGSLIIDRALVGGTNVNLPGALEKIFRPGNPFEKKYD